MNWKLVEKGFRKLISDGFIQFSLCLLIYLTPEKESIVNWAVKRHAALGQISTIIFGISCHELIRRKQNRYIRYTPFCENIFQNRRYVFFDIQHHDEIENFVTLNDKYYQNDNVYIEPSDLVFEIGAGRGMTTQIAAQRAKRVVALEPSPRGFMCASSNLKDVENVELFQYAAWHEPDELRMNYGEQSGDDSLIEPNTGTVAKSSQVRADRIENFAEELSINKIDFLKVEAEGVEPEVLKSIGDLYVSKVVVNCSPERYGESPLCEVKNILREMGFVIEQVENHIVFAEAQYD